MEIKELALPGLLEIRPRIFKDPRGFFFESYNHKAFAEAGLTMEFRQDNQSFSKAGTVRGLHFQHPPAAQGKLVRVLVGQALDVVVDIRRESPTYGKHLTILLDAEQNNMVWVPEGFAHGFAAITDCVFFYKCTHVYAPQQEGGILWNDSDLGIDWQVADPEVSTKDALLPPFQQMVAYF